MEEENRPLISVVIPAYNHENFIGPAIDSVLAQSVSDFELIVIDDGSTDNTGAVVQSYDDPRLSYFYQENQDAFNTINRGLGMARGKYISILNSDDIYTTDRFEKILEFIAEKEVQGQKVVAVITDVIPISDSGEVFTDKDFGWNIWHEKNRAFYFEANDIYTAFLKGNFMVTTSNLFMTREAAEKVGKFCSLRYLHDYDYIFRLMLAYPAGVFYMDDAKLLSYRIHSGNTLGEAAITGRIQDQELIKKYICAAVQEEKRGAVNAGCERLIELGNELHETKVLLGDQRPQGVKPAAREFVSSLKRWALKKVNR